MPLSHQDTMNEKDDKETKNIQYDLSALDVGIDPLSLVRIKQRNRLQNWNDND
jgi:hypothetical protein